MLWKTVRRKWALGIEAKSVGWVTMEGRSRKGQDPRWKKDRKKTNQLDITIISLTGIYNKVINIL